MERELRYEVERGYGKRAKINEVVYFLIFGVLFSLFFRLFSMMCRLALRRFFPVFSLVLFGSLFTSVTPSLSLLLTNLNYTFEPGRILGMSSSRSGRERVKQGEDRRPSLPWTWMATSRVPSRSPHGNRVSLWKPDVSRVGGDRR